MAVDSFRPIINKANGKDWGILESCKQFTHLNQSQVKEAISKVLVCLFTVLYVSYTKNYSFLAAWLPVKHSNCNYIS